MATTHKCNKEKEIAVLNDNINEIKSDLKEIKKFIIDNSKNNAIDETELRYMKKAVFGNGKPGLLERMESLELKIAYWAGGGVMMGFIGSIAINWLIGKF